MIYFHRTIGVRLGFSVVTAGLILLVACSAASAGSYDDAVKASNPFAYWRFEDNGNDEGSTYNGTQVGTVNYAAGTSLFGDSGNRAASFNSTGYFNVGTLGNLGTQLGTNGVGMTLEFWINSSVTSGNMGVFGTSSGGNICYLKTDRNSSNADQDDAMFVSVTNNTRGVTGGTNTDSNVTDGTWNYVALTIQFTATTETVDIYMADAGDTTATLRYHTSNTGVNGTGANFSAYGVGLGGISYGAVGSGNYVRFSGLLDEMAVYDKVLSTSDMDAHLLASTVPEPATMMLLLFGIPFALRRRRK
ncbi:MAG: PEP-CTERM sorting domain-containing protein [Phycisphaerae bacterium]|nr:PEP-CTERM sorting domain-containing protein [Phycisphaerae bacterium]